LPSVDHQPPCGSTLGTASPRWDIVAVARSGGGDDHFATGGLDSYGTDDLLVLGWIDQLRGCGR